MRIYYWKNNIKEDELKKVKETLKKGGIIAFPTDTVYGLACDCFNEDAIEKLYKIKNRPSYKPISVLTDSVEKIYEVVNTISEKEKEIIDKYMPGDLTIILNKNNKVPSILTADIDTIGVRIPKNRIAQTILENYENPLAVTSANKSGKPNGLEVADFIDDFKNEINIIIDGGKSKIGVPSTIVEIEDNNIKILRQGNLKIE